MIFFLMSNIICKDIDHNISLTTTHLSKYHDNLNIKHEEKTLYKFNRLNFFYSICFNISYLQQLIINIIVMCFCLLTYEILYINFISLNKQILAAPPDTSINSPSRLLCYVGLFLKKLHNLAINYGYSKKKIQDILTIAMSIIDTIFIVLIILFYLLINPYLTKKLKNIVKQHYYNESQEYFNLMEKINFYKYNIYLIQHEQENLYKFAYKVNKNLFIHIFPNVIYFFIYWFVIDNICKQIIIQSKFENTALLAHKLQKLLFLGVQQIIHELQSSKKVSIDIINKYQQYQYLISTIIIITMSVSLFIPAILLCRKQKKNTNKDYNRTLNYLVSNLDNLNNNNLYSKYKKQLNELPLDNNTSYYLQQKIIILLLGVMPFLFILMTLFFLPQKAMYIIKYLLNDLYILFLCTQYIKIYQLIKYIMKNKNFVNIFENCYFKSHNLFSERNDKPFAHMENIDYQHVYLTLDNKVILQDINLKIQHGLYLLSGKSGSGKSTLLNSLYGIIEPSHGTIMIENNHFNETIKNKVVEEDFGELYQKYLEIDSPEQKEKILYQIINDTFKEKNLTKSNKVLLNSFSRTTIYNNIGYCPQEINIGNQTIKEFFQIKNKEIDIKDITFVLEKVDLISWFLQQKYQENTYLGDQNNKLSNSHFMRILLAKNLLKLYDRNTQTFSGILLLDETLDKMDQKIRNNIINMLYNILQENKHFVIIVVSHLQDFLLNSLPHKKIKISNRKVVTI